MRPIVVDAGIILEIVTFGPKARPARDALQDAFPVAPGHALVEAAGVVRRLRATKHMTPTDADTVVQRLSRFPLRLYETGPEQITKAWSYRDNFTIADAVYVVLATDLGVPLITLDAAFASPPAPPCEVITP